MPMSGVHTENAICIPADGLPTTAAGTATWPARERPEFGTFVYFREESKLSARASGGETKGGYSFFRIQFFELGTKLQRASARAGRNDFECSKRGRNSSATDPFAEDEAAGWSNVERRHREASHSSMPSLS
jgi:hypothetical protein